MSFLSDLQEGFMNAIDDIRHKVVEQGWFGQETTGDMSANSPEINAPDADQANALDNIMNMFTPPPAQEAEPELNQEQNETQENTQKQEGMDI